MFITKNLPPSSSGYLMTFLVALTEDIHATPCRLVARRYV